MTFICKTSMSRMLSFGVEVLVDKTNHKTIFHINYQSILYFVYIFLAFVISKHFTFLSQSILSYAQNRTK